MTSLVLLTSRIKRSIDSVLTREDLPEVTKREFRQLLEDEESKVDDPPSIPFACVRQLHQLLLAGAGGDSSKLYLHELLEDADIYHPPLKPPPRNPELLARLERLKAEQEDREYRQMTRNVRVKTYGESPLSQAGREVRSFQAQMLGILNVVLTIGGAFVFGYMAAAYQSQPIVIRIVAGCILAFIVAVADLYFLIKTEV